MPWGGFAITSCAVLAGFLRFPPHEMIDELGGQRGEEPGIERQMGHRLVDRVEQRHALARIFRPLEGERLACVDIHSFCSANQRGSVPRRVSTVPRTVARRSDLARRDAHRLAVVHRAPIGPAWGNRWMPA